MVGGGLPEDLVREILSLLPVKSLLRFRCVCKLWCALIQNPSFIALHLNRASQRKSDYLVSCRRSAHNHENLLTIHFDIKTSTNFKMPVFDDESDVLLLGPSNGIICLTNCRNNIILCNPATREFKELPVPNFPYPDHLSIHIERVGFGFDPKTSDYKVVRFFELYDKCSITGFDSCKTQVYSLSSNSWRQIETTAANVAVFQCPWTTTLFNGAFHWCARNGDFYEIILAFHMSDEVFRNIPLPDGFTRPNRCYRGLTVLNDSLALIRYQRFPWVNAHIEIWVMNEYGVKESCTRYYTIRPLLDTKWPLAPWKNSELLLVTKEGQLVSCNLYDQSVERFQVVGASTTLGVVIMYSESLVSI